MIGMTRLIAGKVRVNFEDLTGPVASWIDTVFGPLEAAPHVDAPTEITIRFVDHIPMDGSGQLWPLPIGQLRDGGLSFADHLGHGAAMHFPLSETEVLVSRDIDPWFFQRWIYIPLLKASLWQQRISLMHAAGVSVDGHHIAISGWAGAGKTPVILRLLAQGAEFLGDDWIAISEDGTVHPISAQLNLNSHHRKYIDAARWPGSESRVLPMAVKLGRYLSKVLSKHRKISLGFARLADAAAAGGKVKASLTDIYPSSRMARSGKLEALFFMPRAKTLAPEMAHLSEVIAATSRSELLYCDDLESAVRYTCPGLLDGALFGTVAEEMSVIASALFPVHKELMATTGSVTTVDRLASHITEVVMRRDRAVA